MGAWGRDKHGRWLRDGNTEGDKGTEMWKMVLLVL
jgi:hypothetical protein